MLVLKRWLETAAVQEQISSAVAVLNQKPHLFNTSIMNNIRLGNGKASDEDVKRAARQVKLHDYIAEQRHFFPLAESEGKTVKHMTVLIIRKRHVIKCKCHIRYIQFLIGLLHLMTSQLRSRLTRVRRLRSCEVMR